MNNLDSLAQFALKLEKASFGPVLRSTSDPGGEFFFQLGWRESSCFVSTVTRKGGVAHPVSGCFPGSVRVALQELERARARDAQVLDWAGEFIADDSDELEQLEEIESKGRARPSVLPGAVKLSAHPSLLRALFHVPNLTDSGGNLLRAEPEPGKVVLVLRDAPEQMVHSRLEWRERKGNNQLLTHPTLLCEDALLDGEVIRRIEPLGVHFESLERFPERLPRADVQFALSLLVTAFPTLDVEWDGYEIKASGHVELRPSAIFQSVDENGALVLQVRSLLPGFDSELLQRFDFSRVAQVDEDARNVRISEVDSSKSLLAVKNLVGSLGKLSRKVKGEDAYWRDLENGFHLLGPDLAKVFLRDHLGELAAQFELFGAEKLRSYRIVHHRPKLKLHLGHGIDYFEGEATLDFQGEEIHLWDAIKQFRKERLIRLSDGNQAVVDPAYMARLERLLRKSEAGVKVSFFDLPLVEELLEDSARDSAIPESREFFRGFNTLAARKISTPGFIGSLRAYQKAGVQWLDYLQESGFGGCLADDMGLGKTVQAIALLSKICRAAKAPVLVVMPRSLLFNWRRELETFAPKLTFAIYHQVDRDWKAACKNHVILTTYGTLRSDVETVAQTEFLAVILDESQAIKNIETQTARAACLLRASFRLALSGTPVENDLGEVHALFRFLNPSMFPVRAEFERNYVQPIQLEGNTEAAAELRRKIYPFLLRRLKQDVLKELPPKIEQTLFVEMGPEQARLYAERREFFQQWIRGEIESKGFKRSQLVILEAMLELRQIATVPEAKTDGQVASAKRERLLEAVEEVISNGRKCLVFTNFLAGVEQVSSLLQEKEIAHVLMTGATVNRQELVESFQHDPRVKVFVMTLKTGGVGLNLTAADTVFLLDPWWNTSAEMQAVDRTHRIGQTNTVFTYRLIARGTIEEKILELQARKRALVDSIISSDAGALKELSEEEIDQLFHA